MNVHLVLDRKDRNYVGMVKGRQGFGLPLGPLQALLAGGKISGEDLERDLPPSPSLAVIWK